MSCASSWDRLSASDMGPALPKPYVRDPHYDVLQHLLNCNQSLQANPIGLLTEVAEIVRSILVGSSQL